MTTVEGAFNYEVKKKQNTCPSDPTPVSVYDRQSESDSKGDA